MLSRTWTNCTMGSDEDNEQRRTGLYQFNRKDPVIPPTCIGLAIDGVGALRRIMVNTSGLQSPIHTHGGRPPRRITVNTSGLQDPIYTLSFSNPVGRAQQHQKSQHNLKNDKLQVIAWNANRQSLTKNLELFDWIGFSRIQWVTTETQVTVIFQFDPIITNQETRSTHRPASPGWFQNHRHFPIQSDYPKPTDSIFTKTLSYFMSHVVIIQSNAIITWHSPTPPSCNSKLSDSRLSWFVCDYPIEYKNLTSVSLQSPYSMKLFQSAICLYSRRTTVVERKQTVCSKQLVEEDCFFPYC